jgi:hypothetical protein
MPPPSLNVKRKVVLLLRSFIFLGTIEKATDHVPGVIVYTGATIVNRDTALAPPPSRSIARGADV